jgi:NAD(P)-dependent dehydrogenase (short-subunit alcohol dehydrogenase family)
MGELGDRSGVVTGGGRGIGRAIALKLAAMGASIAIFDLDEAAMAQTVADLKAMGSKAVGIRCDVSSEESVREGFAAARSALGPITVLINNAGIFEFKTVEESSLADWERMMAINLRSAFLCSREVIPDVKQARWGKIVNIGSSAGKTGGAKRVAAYGVSKAGVMVLAKALATELAPYGVNVNAVAPALINTQMMAGIGDLVKVIPLGRAGEPDDVANAVAFLCSEAASFITAEVMDINGGFLID